MVELMTDTYCHESFGMKFEGLAIPVKRLNHKFFRPFDFTGLPGNGQTSFD
jgi:hypothetical protein